MITGFYGGKFLPMHKGHLYCIDTAARQCGKVVVIMFTNSESEAAVRKTADGSELEVRSRIAQLDRVCSLYDNVEFHVIDDSGLCREEGASERDLETPLVRAYLPQIDFVYSSEPSYGEYFRRAYPEAEHILVDAERKTYPISSTMIRAMASLKDKQQWMV